MTRLEFTQATKKARNRHATDKHGVMRCEYCGTEITDANPCEHDHFKEAKDGGDNSIANCRVACKKTCHKKKTAAFKTSCAKSDRMAAPSRGLKRTSGRPIPGSKASGWKRKMSGEVVPR